MATVTPATRRRDLERARLRERRREELLDVADRVIQRHGTGVSMDEIASEAGITKPVLYRHFGDKDGLYEALTQRYVDELTAVLRPAAETASRAPAWPRRSTPTSPTSSVSPSGTASC